MEISVKKLTDLQKIAFSKFKEKIEDLDITDYSETDLLKYLRAKSFDVRGAVRIFRENYYNRIIFEIGRLTETYKKPEVAEKYETIGTLGFAKDGSFIRYTAAGKLDFYGMIMSMSCVDMCLYFCYLMESDIKELREENLKTGRDVNEITYVVDLEGFSIHQMLHKCVIEMGMDFSRLVQDCYPEIWRYFLIVNAPTIFDKAFNIFKPVLRSHTLDRIRVASKDSTKELLLQFIDEDVLPVFLGGKKVDSNGDPRCKEFIKFGGVIPESMYGFNRELFLDPTVPGVVFQTVAARSCYNYCIAIREKQGRRLKAVLRSENGSVTVSILYRKFEKSENPDNAEFPAEDENIDETNVNCKYKAVTVALRAQTHCCPFNNIVYLPWPGVYILRYSNAGSWFSERKLILRHTLLPP